jgi:hypothetical protein
MTVPVSSEIRTELLPLTEPDLGEVANFVAEQSGRDRVSVESHLRWFLLENPARRLEDSLGFGLRSADQLVGCILLSPQMFRFEANDILFMGSSSFYVDDHHRGQGGRIFLQYCRLGRQNPLFGTSANADAAALWKVAGAHSIPYSDQEFLGVLNWAPISEEFAQRKYSNQTISRLAGSPIANLAGLLTPLRMNQGEDLTLTPLVSPEQVHDLHFPSCPAKLTALRNSAYMRWRYFSGHDATAAIFAFRCHQPDQDVLVTINCRKRGYRNQITALHVLDVYPEISFQEWLRVVVALITHYQHDIDTVVLRNLNPELQQRFAERNFLRRTFDAPIGWLLDRFSFLPKTEHYFVPADGDGLI